MCTCTYAHTHTTHQTLCLRVTFLHAVIMKGASDPNFRGFLIQARTCADDTPVGNFSDPGDRSYQQVCNGNVCCRNINFKVHNCYHV